MPQKRIYMDNAATTQIDKDVLKEMNSYLKEKYGNASSAHFKGVEAKKAVEKVREKIARSINANGKEIIFTSGGTESNNLALKGVAFANKDSGNHIITTKIEHKSVLESCKWLETQGFRVTYLNVDKEGFINLKELENSITDKTILVSIIHGNNEIGTIQKLEEIGAICKSKNVLFHTDACQSYTKIELDVEKQHLNLATLNAHKIHGPKGVGCLYIRRGTKITPLQHGGGHERNIRSGTENVAGIVGFGKASELANNFLHVKKMVLLRDFLINELLKIEGTKLNGPKKNRLCNNLNVSFRKIEGEALVGYLDVEGVACSTGSACSEKTLKQSYVLKAIGNDDEEANGSLRISISRFTTKEDVKFASIKICEVVKKLRHMSAL